MKGAGKRIRGIVAVVLSAAVVAGMSGAVYGTEAYATQTEEQPEQIEETVQEPMAAQPKELDLGEYQASMEIGQRQLLTVTVLPLGASASLSYQSSDPSVAEINGMGRITAIRAGETKIQVSCAGTDVSASFQLEVTEPMESRSVQVTELDLGDCPKELTAGSTSLLTVSVIPADATDYELSYQSDHPEVVTVNALGRITAVSPGGGDGKCPGAYHGSQSGCGKHYGLLRYGIGWLCCYCSSGRDGTGRRENPGVGH